MCRPVYQLDQAIGEFLPDIDAIGNPNQIGILEFYARPRVAVIEQDIVSLAASVK